MLPLKSQVIFPLLYVREPGTFSVKNITNATYTWSTSSNLSYTGSGNQITGQRSNSVNGAAWVEVTISTSCSSSPATTGVNFGIGGGPEPTIYDVSESTPICAGQMNYAYNSDSSDGYYLWEVAGGTIVSGQGTSTVGFYADALVWPNTSSSMGLYLTIHGECGDLSKGISIPVNDCSGGGGGTWSVYPNPAGDDLTVKYEPVKAASNSTQPDKITLFEVKLIDDKGRVLRNAKNRDGQESILLDTKEMANGTYFLHITVDKNVEKRQVIIQH